MLCYYGKHYIGVFSGSESWYLLDDQARHINSSTTHAVLIASTTRAMVIGFQPAASQVVLLRTHFANPAIAQHVH